MKLDAAAETSNKIGVLTAELQFVYALNKKHRSGMSSLHILEDIARVVYVGSVFKPFSPFYEEFNELIGRMISSGLFNLWKSEFTLKKDYAVRVEEIGPQVLTLDQMEVAFMISLLPLSLAMVAFLVEIFVHWMKVVFPRVRAFLVLRSYYGEVRRS